MLLFDVMSYKTKITIAVIANILTVLLVFSSIPMIPTMIEAGAPLWLIVLPLVLTIIFAAVSGWLWKKAREAHASATGKLYAGEKLAQQLHAEHGGELIYNEPGTNIRDWSITVKGADGFTRTVMTKSGKETV